MSLHQLAGSSILVFVLLLNIVLLFFFFAKAKRTLLFRHFMLVNAQIFLWLFCQLLDINIPGIMQHQWYLVGSLLPYCFISASWLVFCSEFAGTEFFRSSKRLFFLFTIPTINYILGITNKYHHLFYARDIGGGLVQEYSVIFWLNAALSYLFIVAAIVLLVRHFRLNTNNAKIQIILLITASLLPLLANILHIFKIITESFDITAASLAIPVIIFAVAGYRYEFMDIIPSAMKKIFENLGEGIIVLDGFGKIVFYNKKFWEMTKFAPIKNVNIKILQGRLITLGEKYWYLQDAIGKCMLKSIDEPQNIEFIHMGSYYSVKKQGIINSRNEIIGNILILSDIGEYKKVQQLLKEHGEILETLAIERERTRMARDIHDTIGHSITLLISLLEVAKIQVPANPDESIDKMEQAIIAAKNGLNEIRRSVKGLRSNDEELITIDEKVRQLIDKSAFEGVSIDFTVSGIFENLSQSIVDALYRACQESITNAVRHGDATSISVILKRNDEIIQLYVIDNGKGCGKISKGFGLQAMEERIKAVGGNVNVSSDGETGFMVKIDICI